MPVVTGAVKPLWLLIGSPFGSDRWSRWLAFALPFSFTLPLSFAFRCLRIERAMIGNHLLVEVELRNGSWANFRMRTKGTSLAMG